MQQHLDNQTKGLLRARRNKSVSTAAVSGFMFASTNKAEELYYMT